MYIYICIYIYTHTHICRDLSGSNFIADTWSAMGSKQQRNLFGGSGSCRGGGEHHRHAMLASMHESTDECT